MDIIDQLCYIYYKYEWWSQPKMSYEEAYNYHKERYLSGNIQIFKPLGEILGYYEAYRNGDEVFLFNVWVKPEHRGTNVFKVLYKKFMEQFKECNSIKGEKQKLKGKIMVAKKGAHNGKQ